MFDSLFGQYEASGAVDTYLARMEKIVNLHNASQDLKKKAPGVFNQFDEMLTALISLTLTECNKQIEKANKAEAEYKAKNEGKGEQDKQSEEDAR